MKKQFLYLLIFSLLTLSASNLFSQKTQIGHLDFEGKVMTNNKGLVGALVEVYEGSSKVKTVTTKMFGNFNIKLKFNKKYILKISKNGMVSKNVEVNTTVKDESYVYAFEFEVDLFNYSEGLGTKEITEPVTKISFDERQKEFDFDKAYTKKIKAKVDALYAKQQKLEKQEYTKLITAADKELHAKNYEKAIELYDKAIDADPFAEYPDKQIEICEGLLKEKEKDEKNGDNNAKYAETIKLANAQFDKGEYNKAIPLYEKALNYNSFSDFADKRIDECEKRIDDAADLDRNYKKAITSGNKYLSQKKYENSKTHFEQALALKPNEQYPKDKLAELSKLMGELAQQSEKEKIEAEYQKFIKLADASLKSKKYDDAKNNYNKALGIKANEQYPKDKLKEIEGILLAQADKAKKEQEYKSLIANADKLFNSNNLEESKAKYTSALAIKPNEKYPTGRIKEIDAKLAELANAKQIQEKYEALIKSGDEKLAAKKYESAKVDYQNALNIKSKEEHPKRMIAVCDKALAALASKEENNKKYAALIEKGKTEFANSNWKEAKISFTSAKNIKPEEQFPKIKLKEIEEKLLAEAKEKELEENYKKTIAEADASLKSKNYNGAKTSYEKAIALKSNEQYPKDKLKEVEGLIAAAANKAQQEKEYIALIDAADKLFVNKKYEESKAKYTNALAIKSEEKHPKARIKEIDGILTEIAAKNKREQDYQNLIKAGDTKLASKDYENAKVQYTDALKLKPEQTYPKNKLAEIDKALAALATQKENDTKYAELIKKADASFEANNWQEAKLSYTSAQNIKPNEQYPKDKLKQVEAKLVAEANKKQLEENYKKAIAEADAQLKSKDYSGAKTNYTKASSLKPNEQYPKDKLKEVENLIAAAANKAQQEKEYLALVDAADKLFVNKKYEESKAKYTSALAIKAEEKHPKARIKEIDGILAEIAAKNKIEQDYQNLIKAGDTKLTSKDYENAKVKYTDALKLKPEQTYPKNKLAEIDKALAALASQKENDAKYTELIKKADASFSASKWQEAKLSYTSAQNIKPNEQYPKDKLKEVETKLLAKAKQKELEENYNKAIADADAQLKSKDYSGAKTNYTKASSLKPNDQYPKDKLKEIEGLMLAIAEKAKKEEQYKSIIAEADKLLSANKFKEAKTKYNEALTIKSSEQYPKDKIAEIDAKLVEIANAKAKEKKYNDLIASGDDMFDRKDYENARVKYSDASVIKPTETYPKNRIIEIDNKLKALAEQKRKDEEYNRLITSADSKFAANKFSEAKADYLSALQMKKDEQYPKDKVAEIDKKIAQLANQKSINAKYNKAISTADVYFKAQKYADALNNYNKAIALKPTEQYPKDKAAKAESLLKEAEQKALADKLYKDQMKKADALLTEKKYKEARIEYVKASEMKPDKQLPKDKIANIDATIAIIAANKKKQKEKDTKYKSLIASADKLLATKKYREAKGTYSKASSLKTQEQYPKDKIAEIEAILNKQKAVADKKKEEKPKNIKPQPKLAELKFANAAEKRKYLSSLAKKYPDRKTVENYNEDNGKQIKRIIINNGGIAHEYRKVKQPWGAMYFFKDGKSISKSLFYGETK